MVNGFEQRSVTLSEVLKLDYLLWQIMIAMNGWISLSLNSNYYTT